MKNKHLVWNIKALINEISRTASGAIKELSESFRRGLQKYQPILRAKENSYPVMDFFGGLAFVLLLKALTDRGGPSVSGCFSCEVSAVMRLQLGLDSLCCPKCPPVNLKKK